MYKVVILLLVMGVILPLCGILILTSKKKRTETVSAHILAAREIKQKRKGKSIHVNMPLYFYKLKYQWQGKEYVTDVRTEQFLGNKHEDVLIEINPAHPEQYGADPGKGLAAAMIVIGVLLLLGGLIALVSILSGNV